MRRTWMLALLLAVTAGCASEAFHLVRVVDGDTAILACNHCDCHERVRLLCIDTPATGQAGYVEAPKLLRDFLADADLHLETDPAQGDRDRWGRRLVYVWAGEVNVNLEMIRSGKERYYTKYGRALFDAELAGR